MSMPPDIKKFRTAIMPMAICIFVGGMLVLMGLILVHDGWRIDGRALMAPSAFAALFSLGYSWLLAFIFPDGFSAAGVFSHSCWGRRRFVAWHDIVMVRPFSFYNLKYLRIYAQDGKVAWLALFQSQGTGFRQEIRKFAPPDSPLLKHL